MRQALPPRVTFWRCLIGITALRLLVALALPLTLDEPYYWLWGHHLAAGYYDHPPLVAWLEALFVPFGNAPVVVRASSLLCATLCASLVYFYARRLGDGAEFAGLALLVAPYYSVMAVLAWPESPLLMTWAWTLLTWHEALFTARQEGTPWRWLHAGIALGCCLLAKFTAFAIPIGIALFFAAAPHARRRWLGTLWPWLSLLTALLVYSPFLIWNAQHHWQTFLFQATSRSHSGLELQPSKIPSFIGETLGGLSPLIAIALVPAVLHAMRLAFEKNDVQSPDNEILRLPLAISLPPLFGLWLMVPFATVQVYWTLCCYLGLFPLLGLWYGRRLQGDDVGRWRRRGAVAVALALLPLALGVVAVLCPQIMFSLVARPNGSGLTEMYGGEALRDEMRALRQSMPRPLQTFFAAEDHRLASRLTLSLGEPVMMFTGDRRGLEYLRWEDPSALAGEDCVLLLREPFEVDRSKLGIQLRDAFDRVGTPSPCVVTWHGRPAQTFYFAKCLGFHPQRAGPLIAPP